MVVNKIVQILIWCDKKRGLCLYQSAKLFEVVQKWQSNQNKENDTRKIKKINILNLGNYNNTDIPINRCQTKPISTKETNQIF